MIVMKKKINLILLIILVVLIIVTGAFAYKFYAEKKEQEERQVAKIEEKKEEDKVYELLINYPIKGQIYIDSIASEDAIEEVGRVLESKEYVENIEFISKEQALEEVKTRFKNADYIFDGYEENNIFPASYIFTIKLKNFGEFNKEYFAKIGKDLQQITYVEKIVINGNAYLEIYEKYGIEGLEEYVKSYDVLETMKN
ncbi:MAG: permease-like cell division protein FtsX [Clostridia bacterium]|nr:permease-like cell division protein FtsX [Clostridia bacterium]